jgi:hypothetical protein
MRETARVRNIIFDLGGVVLDWNPDSILENFYSDTDTRAAMKAALLFRDARQCELELEPLLAAE